ncbi:hypothetical protein N566_02055 [Streptomycetaceae bacterium MP113-05]|nr:hypothetical protein N566_02055 [Streptomycetaceae bacterium MP113-05]
MSDLCCAPALIPADHSATALGDLAAPCSLAVGHSGDHTNGKAVWANTTADATNEGHPVSTSDRTASRVGIRAGAVTVSDAGPTDTALLRNAGDVLRYARHTIGDSSATSGELRFAARCLADSLSDVLGIASDAVDGGGEDD